MEALSRSFRLRFTILTIMFVVISLSAAMLTVSFLASPNIRRGAEQELYSTTSTLAGGVSKWDNATLSEKAVPYLQ